MASFYSDAFLHKKPPPTHSTTISWPRRPKLRLGRRRPRLPVVHLGGGEQPRGRRKGLSVTRLFRRVRLRWLRLQYTCILRRLKKYYRSLIRDLIEGSASMEAYQQRVIMESSMAVPVMGISFSNYHGGMTLSNHRSIFM